MKICFICNQIAAWGKIGGFGTNTRRLGRALAERGHEIHVVVPRRPSQGRCEQLDGMTVHGLSYAEVFFGTSLYREIDADVYHVEEPNICGYWAQEGVPNGIHLVTSMDPRDSRDWWIEFSNATWSRRLKYPIQRYFEDGKKVHLSVRQAQGVYVEAEFLKPKTQRLYNLPDVPGLLPKPIEIPDYPLVKADRPVCVFLGRFDPRKRPELFFQLVERMPDIDFVAIGKAQDQAYQKYLERRYFHLPNLQLTGVLDPFRDNQLQSILSRAWILIHPAAREGLPTAFQEASSHEMAILSFVDPTNYVENFGRVVFEGGGVDEFEVNLREMIETGAWREKGKAGRAYNLAYHSVPYSLDIHIETYAQYVRSQVCHG